MKQLRIRLAKKLRQLFDFHQPSFLHLDIIDLVLENKLLVMLSWETAHASKICIQPGKFIYRTSTSAAVCTLPANTDTVGIILQNLWRSKKVSFVLKRIAVDQQTLQYLDELLLRKLTFSGTQPGLTMPSINLEKVKLAIILVMQAPAFNISIDHHQLNDYDS